VFRLRFPIDLADIAIHFSTWAKACLSVRSSRFVLGLDDVSAMSDMRVLH
jgi:hypothetical protein